MAQVKRPETAFTSFKKSKPIKERNHLAFIHTLPCIICGAFEVEAAHIRSGSLEHGKAPTGMAQKPDDCWTLPLCAYHHREGLESQHRMNERAFWQMHNIDPFATAALVFLHSQTGNHPAALQVVMTAKKEGV